MNFLKIVALIGIALFSFGFRGALTTASGTPPVLTATTVIGSMPGVTGSSAHQAGVTTTATIASTQSLTSCNITAGDPSGNFSCLVSGGNATIQMTSTGATNYPGSVDAASQSLTVTGTNTNGTSAGVTVAVNLYNDGYAQARAAGILLPTILTGYSSARRPPFLVPGADYGVGVATGTTLSNPSTLGSSAPFGCTGTTCTITGSSNVTIGNCGAGTGIDFSLNNGWTLISNLTGGAILTVQCSKFGIGSNGNNPVTTNSGSLVLINDIFDGAGAAGSGANHDNIVETFSSLNATIEYCQFTNSFSDFINFTYTLAGQSQALLVQWNVFSSFGGTGTHADVVQSWGVNSSSFKQSFNLMNGPTPVASFPNAAANSILRVGDFQLHNTGTTDCGQTDSCVLGGVVSSYNVATLLGLGFGNIWQIDPTSNLFAGEMPNAQIHDNWVDVTDAVDGVFRPVNGFSSEFPNLQIWNTFNLNSATVILASANNASPPGTPPASAPAKTSLTNVSDVITLVGTAPSGEVITVYDGTTSLGTATSSGGSFTFTSGTLSSGAHTISGADIYANSTGPLAITLP